MKRPEVDWTDEARAAAAGMAPTTTSEPKPKGSELQCRMDSFVETISTLVQHGDLSGSVLDEAEAIETGLADLEAKLTAYESGIIIYVPGSWRCPKCKLGLEARLLSDDMYADTSPQQCLNGCGPMWRVSYQDRVEDFADAQDVLMAEKADLRRKLEEANTAMEHAESESDRWLNQLAEEQKQLQLTLGKLNRTEAERADLQAQVEQLNKRWAHAHRLVNDLWALTDPGTLDKQTTVDIEAELACADGSCPLTREDRLQAQVEALRGALECVIPNCDWLHHAKSDRHHDVGQCPVEERISAALAHPAPVEKHMCEQLVGLDHNPTADRRPCVELAVEGDCYCQRHGGKPEPVEETTNG